ncbi:pseudouridylate synthase I [Haemophilus influenzae]|uniref:Pseudouridylate synthase I n=1 Tax=Haemophilus influenzae TaxID=727 RepID=A0A2X1PQ92_HAEIF|nr:pseudouridylate synthase I [Haemophilus influenzae]
MRKKCIQAGQCLLGEQDFSSFRAAQCQSHTPWRNVHHLNVSRIGKYIIVDIQAERFCASYGAQYCGEV